MTWGNKAPVTTAGLRKMPSIPGRENKVSATRLQKYARAWLPAYAVQASCTSAQ